MRKFSDTYQPEFKLEMNDMEIKGIEATLDGMLHTSFGFIDDRTSCEAFGLAYTSSSGYAIYGATNHVEYDGYEVSHFAITRGGTLIMICIDHAEDGEDYTLYYGFEQDDIFPEVSV